MNIILTGDCVAVPYKHTLMNRTYLLSAVESIAAENGYEFHSADDRYISQRVTAYPAIWLSPPEFRSMEGRSNGKITYAVTLHALDAGAKLSPEERNGAWARMEHDLVELFASLSERSRVVSVENLRIRAADSTLTTHGEVSATATAEVVTFF